MALKHLAAELRIDFRHQTRLFWLGGGFLIGAALLFGFLGLSRFAAVKSASEAHIERTDVIGGTLDELERLIGYGGFIHNFKNLVLRRDLLRYQDKIKANIAGVRQTLGRLVWVQITGTQLRDQTGAPQQIIKQVQDITERREMAQRLEREAHTDYLTGLFNRRHFLELAKLELARARRYHSPLTVAMLDLDHFKNINDSHGHEMGDRVLIELARIGQHCLRESDVLGRIGGEEFAILFLQTDCDHASEVAERLREAIASTEIAVDGGPPIHFTASLGLTAFVDSDKTIDELLGRADRALYAAKNGGRNRVSVKLAQRDCVPLSRKRERAGVRETVMASFIIWGCTFAMTVSVDSPCTASFPGVNA